MDIVIKTPIWHEKNADGSVRQEHCCGCWNFILTEDDPSRPYAKCNECGEIRVARFNGIEDDS